MLSTTGPQDVAYAARSARDLIATVCSPSEVRGSLDEWAAAVAELQATIDTATAAQDAAIARLAAVEPEVMESGEVVETHRALGHVALDAPAIVSGLLVCTAVHAQRRVRSAVRRAADGPDGTDTATGLGGLHRAMADGRLDTYRADVVAHELEAAPVEVAATVVAGLDAHLATEDAPRLRRRVRRMLARISPDLLRQRAVRARQGCRLERYVDEPGVDTWHGTFPTEDAATAWSAIDALAQRYVADGTYDSIGYARMKALTALVANSASVDLRVAVVTTPDGPDPDAPAPAPTSVPSTPDPRPTDLVEVRGLHPGEPVLVERRWLDALPRTAARDDVPTTDAYRPGARLAAFVRGRDGHCRFPGCHVAARFCDLDHVRPWPAGPTAPGNLACLCRRHHRVKQRPGWTVRLEPDGTMVWTDPTGRVRSSRPPDHRDLTVLHDTGTDPRPVAVDPRRVLPDGPFSRLELALEHRLGGRVQHDRGRRGGVVQLHAPRCDAEYIGAACGGRSAAHRGERPGLPDVPPF